MHGTLGMTYTAVEFNFQQILLKTLIPTMNALKDMAVLNIIKTDGTTDKTVSFIRGLYGQFLPHDIPPNPTMDTLKDMAVLNIMKMCSRGQTAELEINPKQ